MQIFEERNPYGFVPFRLTPLEKRKQTAGHDRRLKNLLSGTLTCKLITLRPLCLHVLFEKLRKDKAPAYIPGSTLRGAARNIAQVLGAGCAMLYKAEEEIPNDLKPCRGKEACLACGIFGYAPEGGEQSWSGKVRFHNSDPLAVNWQVLEPQVEQGQLTKGGFAEGFAGATGWRLYRHAREVRLVGGKAVCVPELQEFPFRVDYQNLDPRELSVLRFALSLRHECATHNHHTQLCHKIGFSKASGLGSCRISIESPPAAGCETEEFFKLPGWPAIQDLLDFDRAPQTLVRPGQWLQKHPGGTLEQFEAEHNRRISI